VREAGEEHVKALTGIRAIAAFLVLVYHSRRVNLDSSGVVVDLGPLNGIAANGGFGVDMFFVLSGFVMGMVYWRRFMYGISVGDYFQFIWYRIARVYPLHVVTMAVMLCLYVVGQKTFGFTPQTGHASFSGASVVASVWMVHEWLDGTGVLAKLPFLSSIVQHFGPFGTPNGVVWSISSEFFVYLMFPFTAFLLARRSWPVLVGSLLTAGGLYYLCTSEWHVFDNMIRVVFEFHIGLLTFMLMKARAGVKGGTPHWYHFQNYRGLLVGAVLMCLIGYRRGSAEWNFLPSVMTVSLLLVVLCDSRDYLARMLRTRWILYMGEISYSIYMTHYIVFALVSHGLLRVYPALSAKAWLPAAIVIVGTVVVSTLSFHCIERPFRTRLRALWNSRLDYSFRTECQSECEGCRHQCRNSTAERIKCSF
jgi:peptidoglycan/LPS O-acetylase OafA/YrhL